MRSRARAAAGTWLALGLAACEPQVVDAVEPALDAAPATGGSAGAGSGAGSGAAGGGAGGCSSAGCVCLGEADRDGDGTRDCDDGCPDQPSKTEPGLCGCELPDDDASEPGVASCSGLLAALVHRYAFAGSGTSVEDQFGVAGVVVGSALSGNGAVALEGKMSEEHVDLPNGLVSVLDSATFEAWLTWYGGAAWQRIFDFGDEQSGEEGAQGTGATYLFLTPAITEGGGRLVRVAYQRAGYPEIQLDGTRTFPTGKATHVAVTFDAATETLALYLDGALERSKVFTNTPVRLSVLNDINCWLGRSQYAADPELGASLEEFRIYSAALVAAQVRASFTAGPNPAFLAGPQN